MSFSGQAAVEVVLNDMKDKLRSKLGSVMAMFHSMDKDNSQNLSAEEFKTCLKEFGVVIPGHQLARLISYFDANGDGNVSIPEFAAYMSGNVDAVDALRTEEAYVEEEKPVVPGLNYSFQHGSRGVVGQMSGGTMPGAKLTKTDILFLTRMDADVESRRRTAFITELRKDPRFKESMLEPPKPKFQVVSLEGGPIIKTVKSNRTGLEPKKPFKWGPLGGYYWV